MEDYNYQWKTTLFIEDYVIINRNLQLMKYNERLQLSLKDDNY